LTSHLQILDYPYLALLHLAKRGRFPAAFPGRRARAAIPAATLTLPCSPGTSWPPASPARSTTMPQRPPILFVCDAFMLPIDPVLAFFSSHYSNSVFSYSSIFPGFVPVLFHFFLHNFFLSK
jgi:hypothetical protein